MGKIITYNGIDPFEGQHTPFFSKGVEYLQVGERWGQVESWALNGILTGCDFTDLEQSRLKLLRNFASGFGTMNIATGTFILDPVEIRDISIEDSDYIGGLPYTINFVYYPSGSFTGLNHSGFFGVTDPVDTITYNEGEDGVLQINREISAKGFITDSTNKDSALNNVKNFIAQRKDVFVKPFLVKNIATSGVVFHYHLVSSDESYNRISNDGRLSQVYRSDLIAASGAIVNRYTIDTQQNMSQPIMISYRGEINAGKYAPSGITGVREAYLNFRSGIATLFLTSEEVVEDTYINKLTYSFSYYSGASGNNFPQVSDDITITVEENSESSLFNASVQGGLNVNYGCLTGRLELVSGRLDLVQESNYHFPLIQMVYENFYTTNAGSKQAKPTNIYLNPNPISRSKDIDLKNNTATYSATFNDRYIPNQFTGCTTFSENVSIAHAISQRAIKENYLGGYYICQDLGAKSRERITVTLTRDGVITHVGSGVFYNYALELMNNLQKADATKVYIEEPSYTSGNSPKNENYNVGRSYNTTQDFETESGYTP